MEGAELANEGAVLPGGANGSKDAKEEAANQQRDGRLAVANEDDPLQGSANERKGSCGSANQDAEMREATNDSKEPTAANEDTAHTAPPNEDRGHKPSINQSSAHKSPANQDTVTPSTNQNAAPRPNERQAPPLQDDFNDLTPLAAAANQARDPWDWSLEEAWLRAPDEEGLAAWGAELEGLEAEPDDDEEEEELEDWEVELENCGVEPAGQGVELKHSEGTREEPKEQGVGLKTQRAGPEHCGVNPNDQGVELKPQGEELEHSKDQGAELKAQGVELKAQGVELKDHGAELECCGVDPKDQGVEPKDHRAEHELCGAVPNAQGVELKKQGAALRTEGADPSPPEASHWLPSPDGAWSKLTIRPGRGLARPGPGSLCRVRLSVPPSPRSPWGSPAASSGCGQWRNVRLGSAEGRWASLLDAALETMARGERARLRPSAAHSASLSVRLGRFTAPPPFWAVPPPARWRSVRSGLAHAAELLSSGRASAAAAAFRRSLRSAAAAAGPAPLGAEARAVKAELHAGLARAQLRLGLAAAAAANAGKALELRPAHLGARYARGVASAAMMDLELAREDLRAVLRARPGHAGASRELGRVRDKARQRDTQLATRLGKMFA